MVLLLVYDIFPSCLPRRGIHCKYTIPLSPFFPIGEMRIRFHEFAALRFQYPYKVSDCNCGSYVAKYMDMIGHAPDAPYIRSACTRKIEDKFVELPLMLCNDGHGTAICTYNQMICKDGVTHDAKIDIIIQMTNNHVIKYEVSIGGLRTPLLSLSRSRAHLAPLGVPGYC